MELLRNEEFQVESCKEKMFPVCFQFQTLAPDKPEPKKHHVLFSRGIPNSRAMGLQR